MLGRVIISSVETLGNSLPRYSFCRARKTVGHRVAVSVYHHGLRSDPDGCGRPRTLPEMAARPHLCRCEHPGVYHNLHSYLRISGPEAPLPPTSYNKKRDSPQAKLVPNGGELTNSRFATIDSLSALRVSMRAVRRGVGSDFLLFKDSPVVVSTGLCISELRACLKLVVSTA